jgi:DMSO/TMAO reductase YedYZ molybdopterin-dependent catalytic subunit
MKNTLHASRFPLRRAWVIAAIVLFVLLLAACMALPATEVAPAPAVVGQEATPTDSTISATLMPTGTPAPVTCDLTPVAQPTMPDVIPGYAQEDPATGLHMTGRPQLVDLATYRLNVTGLVDHPLSLTYDELRCMPKVVQECRLVCPGFFVDSATWGGVPFGHVLELAGVQKEAENVVLVSADGYWTSVPLGDALAKESFLAYEQTGRTLPVLHGFPVRAIFPLLPGGKWVKWLVEIQVVKDAPTLGPASLVGQPTAATP